MTKRKIIFVFLIAMVLLSICTIVVGCKNNPDDYTLEEHVARISKRIEKKYISKDSRQSKYDFITDYRLYPLYSDLDKLEYFLVEFEPYGFAFVSLSTSNLSIYGSMYHYNEVFLSNSWQRYRLCINGEEPNAFNNNQLSNINKDYGNKRFETDDDGNFIEYNRSPYTVANVLNEKMYFLKVPNGFVPAIRQDEKYFNLVSMEEFEYDRDVAYSEKDDEYFEDRIPMLSVGFVIKWTL